MSCTTATSKGSSIRIAQICKEQHFLYHSQPPTALQSNLYCSSRRLWSEIILFSSTVEVVLALLINCLVLGSGAALALLCSQSIVLINVDCLPRVADPNIANSSSSRVSPMDHVMGEESLFWLVLVLIRCQVNICIIPRGEGEREL